MVSMAPHRSFVYLYHRTISDVNYVLRADMAYRTNLCTIHRAVRHVHRVTTVRLVPRNRNSIEMNVLQVPTLMKVAVIAFIVA